MHDALVRGGCTKSNPNTMSPPQRQAHRVDIRHSPALVRMRSSTARHTHDNAFGAQVSAEHPSVVQILTATSDNTKGTYAEGNWGECAKVCERVCECVRV